MVCCVQPLETTVSIVECEVSALKLPAAHGVHVRSAVVVAGAE